MTYAMPGPLTTTEAIVNAVLLLKEHCGPKPNAPDVYVITEAVYRELEKAIPIRIGEPRPHSFGTLAGIPFERAPNEYEAHRRAWELTAKHGKKVAVVT